LNYKEKEVNKKMNIPIILNQKINIEKQKEVEIKKLKEKKIGKKIDIHIMLILGFLKNEHYI
jgi:hypothetical protein